MPELRPEFDCLICEFDCLICSLTVLYVQYSLESGAAHAGECGDCLLEGPQPPNHTVEFNSDIDITYCSLKLILLKRSIFGRTPKTKHAKSGGCSRRINFRKQYFYIDIGVKVAGGLLGAMLGLKMRHYPLI